MRRGVAALAVAVDSSGGLPTEFRLFVSGWNDSENGRFLFDAEAAKLVMEHDASWGVERMIDLEHQALDDCTPPEPTARDARGWFKLELREDGSLWAVDVTWTPDGAQRLTERRQRYVSPAFGYDPETCRITQIINVAITSIPATHETPALVAAAARGRIPMAKFATLALFTTAATLAVITTNGVAANEALAKMPSEAIAKLSALDPKLVAAALDAVSSKDAKSSLDILKNILAALLGTAAAPDPEDAPPPAGDGGADESTEAAKKDAMAAAARVAMSITGKTDPGEAMAELARSRAIAVDIEQREARLTADRATIEGTERRALVGQLVKAGREIPATAWKDAAGTVPCDRLQAEPIAELRARVALLTNGVRPAATTQPPAGGGLDAHGLDERELAICAETKCEPKVFAMLKSRRSAA